MLYLQDLLKVIMAFTVFPYLTSFSICLDLFDMYMHDINYDVKLCTDHCKLLENHVFFQDY